MLLLAVLMNPEAKGSARLYGAMISLANAQVVQETPLILG